MATLDVKLPPVTNRRTSPFYLWGVLSQPAGTNYNFKAGWNLDVPNYWQLYYLKVGFAATADAANRYIYLVRRRVQMGANKQFPELATDAIVANESKNLILERTSGWSGCSDTNDFHAILNSDSWIFGGDDYLYLYFQGDVAGDLVTVTAEFRWLNWELGLEDPLTAVKPLESFNDGSRQVKPNWRTI